MIHIARPQDCCGCTACFSACAHKAIELVSDAEGFLYPAVKMDLCTDCGVCEKVCPAMHRKSQTSHSKPKAIKAIRIKDAQLLERSSSGGVFIAASQYVKTSYRGGICGAKYSDQVEVVHGFAENMDDVYAFMGSRYKSICTPCFNIFIQN